MKRILANAKLLLVSFGVVFMASCQKDDQFNPEFSRQAQFKSELKENKTRTFNSSTLPVGGGIARAWVTENSDGQPVSVGITLSEKALEKLPEHHAEYVFILPENKGENFYKVVQLNWNPQGHFPPNVYDLPHFDFHFYIIPNDERLSIEADDLAEFANEPAPQYVPSLYLHIPGGEPAMGAHWADLLSPELNGGLFTKTFILGSYDGRFIFYEPMITLDYLLTKPNVTVPVRQPAAFQQDGYYPANYKINYSNTPKEYNISLDLVYHEGE